MREAAIKQGMHQNFNKHKIQIISVQDLLNNKLPDLPDSKITTFKNGEAKIMDTDEMPGELDLE